MRRLNVPTAVGIWGLLLGCNGAGDPNKDNSARFGVVRAASTTDSDTHADGEGGQ